MGATKSSSSDSAVRLAWVAGLFEGEGCVQIRPPARPQLQVISTDRDVVERLLDWTGVGHVTGPHTASIKPAYRWTVTKRDDAANLIAKLLPLMCERRAETMRAVLAEYQAAAPTLGTAPTCGYGHELTGDNLRLVDGRRRCLQCQARRQREHRARRRKVA